MAARFLLFILLLLLPPIAASASPKSTEPAYDVFYLVVGSSYYETDGSPHGFNNLGGANKSAKTVADYLDQAGAVTGITLVSDRDKFVTRGDVLKALSDLLVKVKRSKPKNPLVVFYFCGHGVSEGVGWNHFSIPGNFVVPKGDIDIQTLMKSAVYAGEISDVIEVEKLAGLLLLDTCYEGKLAELPEAVISRQLAENLTDIFKVLRHINEFRGPTLAVFSTAPGTLALMVPDPLDPESSLSVGPLARRVMLSFDQAFRSKSALTVGQFLRKMSSATFDPETRSVVTLSVPAQSATTLIRYPVLERSVGELRFGTGRKRLTSKANTSERPTEGPPPAFNYRVSSATYLAFSSEPNEYIGNGETRKLIAGDLKFTVEQDDPDQISLSIKEGELQWELTFVAPKGKILTVGAYTNGQRAGFQDDSNPGFALSGSGRGCGEVNARFHILNIKRDRSGRLVEFDADFVQRCDGATESLRGQLRFRADN
jgi:Caspase domain